MFIANIDWIPLLHNAFLSEELNKQEDLEEEGPRFALVDSHSL